MIILDIVCAAMNQQAVTHFLHNNGLIASGFRCVDLPQPIVDTLQEIGGQNCQSLYIVLLSNAGGQFWHALASQPNLLEQDNDQLVDGFSQMLAAKFIQDYLSAENSELLYPSKHPLPLIQLGQLAGLTSASPLGLGISPEYGPWIAHRALILTSSEPPKEILTTPVDIVESPCLSCRDTPCVQSCPALAVSVDTPFDIRRCYDFRNQQSSSCAANCHARNACPVGTRFRYSEDQLKHHMLQSLPSLRKWLA